MPEVIMVKPWDAQYVANVLYRLYAEQKGLPQGTVIATPKTPEELAARSKAAHET